MTHQGTTAEVLRARIGASLTLFGAGALSWLDDTGGLLGTALFTTRCVTLVLAGAGLSASVRLWWRDRRPPPARVARPARPTPPGTSRPGRTEQTPNPAPSAAPPPSSSGGPQDLPLPGGWAWTRRGPDLLVTRPDLPTLAVRLAQDAAQPPGPETQVLWQDGPDLDPVLTPAGWRVSGSAAHLTRLLEVL